METEADSIGNYVLCGVPTSTGISVRAANDSAETGWIDIPPLDRTRVARQDLDLGTLIARLIADGKGATLRGQVSMDSSRAPIAHAEMSLPQLGLTAESNDQGEAVINNIIPGSHLVVVRRIGYSPIEQRLEFVSGQTTIHTISLSRITVLDSVTVTARTSPRDEGMRVFAENQKRGFGSFVTRMDLAVRDGQKLSSVMAQLEGIFVLRGHGGQAWVASRRQPRKPRCMSSYITPRRGELTDAKLAACARSAGFYLPDEGEASMGMAAACYSTVYLDGVVQNISREPFNLNTISVDQIEALEWYSGVTQIPIEYTRRASNCGVLVIHSRRHKE